MELEDKLKELRKTELEDKLKMLAIVLTVIFDGVIAAVIGKLVHIHWYDVAAGLTVWIFLLQTDAIMRRLRK